VDRNSLTILGSSSGMPQADRATSGYVLKVQERLSLLDCGGGVCSSFVRCGFDPLAIERIFVSHTHSDHVCELPLVIQMVYLAGRKDKLDIYVPSEFVAPLKTYLTAVYLIEEKLPFTVNIIGYEDGFTFSEDFRLTAIGNRHLQGHAELISELKLPNKMQCHSFDIKVGDKSLFYSSDVFSFEDVRNHLDGRDYVVLESTHIDLEEFFDFTQAANVGRYVITHLGTLEEVAGIEQRARKAGLENLVMAVDGMELVL
jgi:ribonuclease BN (tRNA processing enzyme)